VHGYEPIGDRPSDYAVPATFRFVDAHVHLFDHSAPGLSWGFHDPGWEHPRLKGAWRLDRPAFSVPQFRSLVAGLGVDKMVHVQAADPGCGPVAETAWLQGLADRYSWPNAIVGPCPLASDSAPSDLAAQSAHANWRGVRDTGDPAAIGTDDWNRGFAALVGLGGSVDLMINREQFDQAHAVAARHPESTVVLEHAGAPVISKLDSYFEDWRLSLARLATADNVVCKISALSSMALPAFFTESIRRWVMTCLDLFGTDRCFFATNWPMDALFTTYPRLLSSFRTLVEELTPAEQAAVFATNAERVYRI